MNDQENLLKRAGAVLPGGVLGSHRSGPGLEFVVRDARGPHLWDAAGRRYIDYLLGSGPMLLGHAHPAVVEAVQRQAPRGTTFMLLNEPIIELAEELVRAVPCAEQVRFMSSGSEATFFALRVARAFRKRDRIMKFEGGFHGTHDYALMSVSPRSPKAFPAAVADSAGIPHAVSEEVLIAPYNDLATVEAQISDVLRFEEIKSFLVFDFPKSATIRMRGKVIGGFDLSSPEFHVAPDADRRLVKVALPPPRILALDPRLEWFDEEGGFFNPITPQDRTRWLLWARGQLARAAKQAGIEARATEHARELLSGAGEAFGWKVEVTAEKVGSDATPAPTP